MKKFAIIVAGGAGTRMKSDVPKQFLLHDGEPIIVKTIGKFLSFDPSITIVVVLPEKHLPHWQELKQRFPFISAVKSAIGGATRTESVLSGLNSIEEREGLVAIHDAVRPFVTSEVIGMSYASAAKWGSGVAAVGLKDSIREITGDSASIARDRSNFVMVQTPQTFNLSDIRAAFEKVGNTSYTDDASVYEAAGNKVFLIEGSYANIKITTPEDLK